MKLISVILLMGFLAIKSFGQPSVDIGVFGGAGTSFGDMTNIDFQKSVNPAYGGFIRYNFNQRYGLRFNVINGNIGAEGNYNAQTWSFHKNVMDVSLLYEFNYLKYIVGDKVTPWSSFIFFGLGMQTYNYDMDAENQARLSTLVDPSYFLNIDPEGPVMTATLPIGFGVKFNLSKRIGIGMEGRLVKSFSDKLDDLDDPQSYMNNSVTPPAEVKFTDTWHNNDWTAYLGVHLVYKLIYGNKNWELRTPRKKMVDWGIWNSNRNR